MEPTRQNLFELMDHVWWVTKNAASFLWFYIRHPYHPIRATHPCSRFNTWHEHICLPLRLGKDLYMHACPHAARRKFIHEYEDECDGCPYQVIIDLDEGIPYLYGDERFVHRYGDNRVDEEEKA